MPESMPLRMMKFRDLDPRISGALRNHQPLISIAVGKGITISAAASSRSNSRWISSIESLN